ncbi:hypothetical protein DBR06_SOUSAS12810109, partial [Sousa chinensis]
PHALGAGSQTRGPRWWRKNYNSQQSARRAAPTVRRGREGRDLYKPLLGEQLPFSPVTASLFSWLFAFSAKVYAHPPPYP